MLSSPQFDIDVSQFCCPSLDSQSCLYQSEWLAALFYIKHNKTIKKNFLNEVFVTAIVENSINSWNFNKKVSRLPIWWYDQKWWSWQIKGDWLDGLVEIDERKLMCILIKYRDKWGHATMRGHKYILMHMHVSFYFCSMKPTYDNPYPHKHLPPSPLMIHIHWKLGTDLTIVLHSQLFNLKALKSMVMTLRRFVPVLGGSWAVWPLEGLLLYWMVHLIWFFESTIALANFGRSLKCWRSVVLHCCDVQ